jgi:hypothetical protein
METTFQYLRQFGTLLAERILKTYPPLQSTKDPVAPALAPLLRKALPAQALAITGTAKCLRKGQVSADCGRVRSWQNVPGTRHNPRSRRRAPKYHAGDVSIAYHAQLGARGLADHPARPRLPHRGHEQWGRSQPAARHLRGEAEQKPRRFTRALNYASEMGF